MILISSVSHTRCTTSSAVDHFKVKALDVMLGFCCIFSAGIAVKVMLSSCAAVCSIFVSLITSLLNTSFSIKWMKVLVDY